MAVNVLFRTHVKDIIGVHDQLGCGLVFDGDIGEPPRISLALWAKALVASTIPIAIVASEFFFNFIMAILSRRSDFHRASHVLGDSASMRISSDPNDNRRLFDYGRTWNVKLPLTL